MICETKPGALPWPREYLKAPLTNCLKETLSHLRLSWSHNNHLKRQIGLKLIAYLDGMRVSILLEKENEFEDKL